MKPKMIIVDDDTNFLSVLENFFSGGPCAVSTCSNGLDAVRRCREEPFDLVITDIIMPGMSGLEVLREVRKINQEVLVILITGFASLETAIGAIREGAYDYITKPFKLEEIQIAVMNALDKIRLVRENRNLLQELQDAYEQLREAEKNAGDAVGGHGGIGKTFIAGNALPDLNLSRDTGQRTPFISDLERISRLKDKGFISEREFELCKSRLFQPLK